MVPMVSALERFHCNIEIVLFAPKLIKIHIMLKWQGKFFAASDLVTVFIFEHLKRPLTVISIFQEHTFHRMMIVSKEKISGEKRTKKTIFTINPLRTIRLSKICNFH